MAPIRCSASTARRRRTLVSGVTVTTCVPLTRSTSLIRIRPSQTYRCGADCVSTATPRLLLQPAVAGQVIAVDPLGADIDDVRPVPWNAPYYARRGVPGQGRAKPSLRSAHCRGVRDEQ